MVFRLSALWWRRMRSLRKISDERDWLRGKLGLILMGRAMLSKSLIHFLLMGGAVFPPCCLTWGQTVVEVMKIMAVQFSHSVLFNSSGPHESQNTRPPCPSPAPGVYSNSCPSSRWCHPTISSSVIPFSACPQSLPASGFFPVSQLFAWGGQSIGVSVSASVLPMNSQNWSLGWTGWISLLSKGLSRVFSNITVQKHQFFSAQLSSQSNSHIQTWPLE